MTGLGDRRQDPPAAGLQEVPESWEGGIQGRWGEADTGGPWATCDCAPRVCSHGYWLRCREEAALGVSEEQLLGCGPCSLLCSSEAGSQDGPRGSHRQKSLKATGGQEGLHAALILKDHTERLGFKENPEFGLGLPQHPSLGFMRLCSRLPSFKCSLSSIAMVPSLHSACPSTSAQSGRPAYPHARQFMKRVKEPLSLERQQEKQQKHKAEPHSLDSALKRAPRDISRSSPSYDAQTRLTWTGEVARYSHLVSLPFLPLPFSSPAHTISSLRICARNREGTRTNPNNTS